MQNINFDDLFAYRFLCQDTIIDEILIIRKLKYYLYDNNFPLEEIDNYIYQFYVTFNYPISLEEIKLVEIDVNIPDPSENIALDVIQNNIIDPSINNEYIIFNISLNMELIEFFINILNQNTLNEDVVVTTDDVNDIKKIELDEMNHYNCSICMDTLKKGDTVLDIECKHIFHSECLTEYLEKYNHICPICRKDIGKSKINY